MLHLPRISQVCRVFPRLFASAPVPLCRLSAPENLLELRRARHVRLSPRSCPVDIYTKTQIKKHTWTNCLPLPQVRKLPKVNREEHVRLQAAAIAGKESEKSGVARDGEAAATLLEDERFAAMFDDADFAVDRESKVFKELNPNAGAHRLPCCLCFWWMIVKSGLSIVHRRSSRCQR